VLDEAQALGYAEADPTADVDGFDAMYKLAILASIAFGERVSLESILREGIRGVGARDIEYATEMGFVIKLVALARQHPGGEIELRVHPTLLPRSHPLASVNDVFNGVLVHGDACGRRHVLRARSGCRTYSQRRCRRTSQKWRATLRTARKCCKM
jgi:homoserine dehydrogenase